MKIYECTACTDRDPCYSLSITDCPEGRWKESTRYEVIEKEPLFLVAYQISPEDLNLLIELGKLSYPVTKHELEEVEKRFGILIPSDWIIPVNSMKEKKCK